MNSIYTNICIYVYMYICFVFIFMLNTYRTYCLHSLTHLAATSTKLPLILNSYPGAPS